MQRKKIKLGQSLLIGTILLFILTALIPGLTTTTASTVAQSVEVHFIDVGQGDSILIKTDTGRAILIDGGDRGEGAKVVKYIKDQGIKELDLVVSTHPHADHIAGLIDVLNAFPVKRVLDAGVAHTTATFRDYLGLIQQKKIPYDTPSTAKEYNFDGVLLKVLGPVKSHKDLNDSSVIVKLIFRDFSVLFTGDAELTAETDLLKLDLRATVLKVGHHGSSTSTSQSFLTRVNPKEAVISLGKGNRYGHPAEETLQKLNKQGVNIYRTDEQGTIIISSTGKDYRVNKSAVNKSANTKTNEYTGAVVGSKNSDVYHRPDCTHVERISQSNKIWFNTVADAVKAKYRPCSVCFPGK